MTVADTEIIDRSNDSGRPAFKLNKQHEATPACCEPFQFGIRRSASYSPSLDWSRANYTGVTGAPNPCDESHEARLRPDTGQPARVPWQAAAGRERVVRVWGGGRRPRRGGTRRHVARHTRSAGHS